MDRESIRILFDAAFFKLPNPKLIRTPMLVMGGPNDSIFPPHEVRATARAYATKARILSDTAHDIMLDKGWELAADEIIDWIPSVTAPAPITK